MFSEKVKCRTKVLVRIKDRLRREIFFILTLHQSYHLLRIPLPSAHSPLSCLVFQAPVDWINSITKIQKLDENSARDFFNIVSVSRVTRAIKKHHSIGDDSCDFVISPFMTDLFATARDLVELIMASEDSQSHNSIFHNAVMAL